MRAQSLHFTTLLSLLGLAAIASAQTTRDTDFSVFTSSPSTLLSSTVPKSDSGSTTILTGDFLFTISRASPTESELTLSTPIFQNSTTIQKTTSPTTSLVAVQTASQTTGLTVAQNATTSQTTLGTPMLSSTPTPSPANGGTTPTNGAAAPTGYMKLGIAGVLGAAAGVLIL